MIAATLLALTLGGAGGFYGYVEAGGNFHVVEKDTLYRSRQLSGPELERAIATYGIRSVLNLRGAYPGKDWYDEEIAVSASRHVAHYDYGIAAERPVAPGQLREILRIIRDAPKPMLVHCKAGADRTGLVSAVYLFSRGAKPDQAEGQLSLRYGHFPWFGSGTRAMEDSFDAYTKAAAEPAE